MATLTPVAGLVLSAAVLAKSVIATTASVAGTALVPRRLHQSFELRNLCWICSERHALGGPLGASHRRQPQRLFASYPFYSLGRGDKVIHNELLRIAFGGKR